MCCDMLILDVVNVDDFYDDGYDYGVGVGDEDGGFGWGGLILCVKYVLVTYPIYQKGWYVELWPSL